MQQLLKTFISDLHSTYFKPNGFKKERQRFRRNIDKVTQEIEFQSSSWNSSGEPITFYVNISVWFDDIQPKSGEPLKGSGRIEGLVPAAPPHFDLTPKNYKKLLRDLYAIIPQALSVLPEHYEDVRTRAKKGLYTPIPLPDNWRK